MLGVLLCLHSFSFFFSRANIKAAKLQYVLLASLSCSEQHAQLLSTHEQVFLSQHSAVQRQG